MFAPRDPDEYLLDTERRVIRIRRHWAVLLWDTFEAAALLAVCVLVSYLLPPALYIGPDPSHVTDLKNTNYPFSFTRHGDTSGVVAHIVDAHSKFSDCERRPLHAFSKHTLLPEMIGVLEAEPESEPYSFVREVTLP